MNTVIHQKPLYTLNGWVAGYMKYISIKLFLKKALGS